MAHLEYGLRRRDSLPEGVSGGVEEVEEVAGVGVAAGDRRGVQQGRDVGRGEHQGTRSGGGHQ